MSVHFHRELDRLIEDMIAFSENVEGQLTQAIEALVGRDVISARNIIKNDGDVDQSEVELEEECLKLLALHQPLAGDLRQIVTVMKINCDLERVGDHAANIAQRVLDLDMLPPIDVPEKILEMSKQARLMLRMSLLSFVESDNMLTQGVFEMEDKIDMLNNEIFKQQVKEIENAPVEAEQRILYMSVCKQLERIGDLASNISEDVVYLMSGDIIRHHGKEYAHAD